MAHPDLIVCDECLPPHALSVTNAAKASTVDCQTLSNQMNGCCDISSKMVLQLEATFGVPAQTGMKGELAGVMARAHEIKVVPFGEAARR